MDGVGGRPMSEDVRKALARAVVNGPRQGVSEEVVSETLTRAGRVLTDLVEANQAGDSDRMDEIAKDLEEGRI